MNKLNLYILYLLVLMGWVQAAILNGGFEIPDPNDTPWFTPALNWTRISDNPFGDCYAGLHESFVPNPEHGQTVQWTIPGPYEGSKFVVLSTGDLGPDSDREISEAEITQIVEFNQGDTISGAFFFGTCDYFNYNDYGQITLSAVNPTNDPNEITLAFMNVETIGNFSSTNEWIPFTYTFNNYSEGAYVLSCYVADDGDTIYKSFLAVDGLQICKAFPNEADINSDCSIDLEDFWFLSRAWLAECPDPNAIGQAPPSNPPDPNCPCEEADINDDWIVDPNDLMILTNTWLENGK